MYKRSVESGHPPIFPDIWKRVYFNTTKYISSKFLIDALYLDSESCLILQFD